MRGDSSDVLARVEETRERALHELLDYLRIPSISTDPDYRDEVRAAAEYLRERMEEAGLDAELVDTDGHPLVYGERVVDPGRPTILYYGHYDVQPPDPLDEWETAPFEPRIEEGKIYARGATDDKGQSYTHVKAVAAVLEVRDELPVNVKFLYEGEEESGGTAIESFVREDGGERLAADCVVISDTAMHGPGKPAIIYALRGLAYMEVRVTGPDVDLHSGIFGGAVANPANALAEIISRLKDQASGRVLVPGFYDDVRELEGWEREELSKLAVDPETYRRSIGVPELVGETGYSTVERVTARPTCDVNGLWSGYQGRGAKTVLPARAGAKISMRLVPDQEPEEVAARFVDYVDTVCPPGVRVEATMLHGGRPVRLRVEGPFIDAAKAALEETFDTEPVLRREGGSIPIVGTFVDVLEAPVVLMGFGLPDDGLHSPNEKFDVAQFYSGIEASVRFLDRVGQLGR